MPPGPMLLDAVVGLIVIEFAVLSLWLARRGASSLIPALASFLASGALLMLALRFTLTEPQLPLLALLMLTLSFPIHVATLWLVWRRFGKAP
ncbi:MAG: hypothetical protein AAGL90_07145 [Pseudomonadota bacterium]